MFTVSYTDGFTNFCNDSVDSFNDGLREAIRIMKSGQVYPGDRPMVRVYEYARIVAVVEGRFGRKGQITHYRTQTEPNKWSQWETI